MFVNVMAKECHSHTLMTNVLFTWSTLYKHTASEYTTRKLACWDEMRCLRSRSTARRIEQLRRINVSQRIRCAFLFIYLNSSFMTQLRQTAQCKVDTLTVCALIGIVLREYTTSTKHYTTHIIGTTHSSHNITLCYL